MAGLNHLCMHYGADPLSKIFAEAVQAADVHHPASLSSSAVKWQPPPAGCVKLNSDAALDGSRSLVDVRLVLRDQHFGRSLSPLAAEGEAVLKGLKFALDIGILSIVVESDASSLVNLINGKVVALSEIGLVVTEIQNLCSNFQNCSFIFGSMKVN
ncbi:hypothetical protein ACOSP7_027406 [Xanthoceras sorbifolium]